MSTLYEIQDRLAELTEIIVEAGGDWDALSEEEQTEFDGLAGALEQKIISYAHLIKRLEQRASSREAEAAWIAAEAARITTISKRDRKTIKTLSERAMGVMEANDLGTIETEHFRIKVVRNGGAAPLEIDKEADPMKVSPKLSRQPKRVWDKKVIRELLEADAPIPFARLLERGRRLKIS